MDITSAMADAALDAWKALINDGGGTAEIQIWTAAFATKLAAFTLNATPFGAAESGGAGYRQIPAAAGDFTQVGLAAGTAAKYRIVSEAGTTRAEGSVSAAGGGGEVIVSNTSIAVDQPVTLVSFVIKEAFTI